MIHWEEGEDERGLWVWLRFIDCGHWGLILTGVRPRWWWVPAAYQLLSKSDSF